MALNADDTRAISKLFREAAVEILDFIDTHESDLSRGQIGLLNGNAKLLLSAAGTIRTEAVDLAIDDLAQPAQELQSAIAAAKEKIETLNDIRKAILITAGLTGLASGVVAKDPKAIVGALGNIRAAFTARAPDREGRGV